MPPTHRPAKKPKASPVDAIVPVPDPPVAEEIAPPEDVDLPEPVEEITAPVLTIVPPVPIPVVDVLTDVVSTTPITRLDGEAGTLTVALRYHENGRDSSIDISGLGIGRHQGSMRIQPDDLTFPLDFEGDSLVADYVDHLPTEAIVVIDNLELRTGATNG